MFSKNCRAPHFSFVEDVWSHDDLVDLRVPVNELAYQIQKRDHSTDTQQLALYWLQWIFQWDKTQMKKVKNKKKSACFLFSRRVNKFTDTEWATDYVWVIWELMFRETEKGSSNNRKNVITSLFRFFCSNYKVSTRSQKKMFLSHAALITLNTIPKIQFTKPIYTQYDIVLQSVLNINSLYIKICDSSIPHQKGMKTLPTQSDNKRAEPAPTHPMFSHYMDNRLYLDPQYSNKIPKKERNVLDHLDKFFGVY